MTDGVRAAMGRCRDVFACNIVDVGNASVAMLEDLLLLARAFAREHPADDGEPVTEAWLRSVGFGQVGEKYPELWLPPETKTVSRWRLEYVMYQRPWDDAPSAWDLSAPSITQHLGYDLPTRGDVRRTCKILGIPLTEPTP